MSTPPPEQPSGPESSSKGWLTPRTVGIAAIVVVSLLFVFGNTQRVKVRFLIPKFSAPLWLALVLAFALGAAFGLFLSWRRARRSAK
jgi:uncharacterized integral membrane protein